MLDDIYMFGTEQIGSSLHPSDHWGIAANFRVSNKCYEKVYSKYHEEFDQLNPNSTGCRSFKCLISLWFLTLMIAIMVVYLLVKLIKHVVF